MSDITLRLYTQKKDANLLKLYDDFGIEYNNIHYKCIFREIENYDELVADFAKAQKDIIKLQKSNLELTEKLKIVSDSCDILKDLNKVLGDKVKTGRWINVKRTGTERVYVEPLE